ncbi:MAG TPA: serine--tRNA ligase, partial [Microbacteriaceae bacterium]|nr:serine--tRNA ligase [Microbacteriaceae bacterium]
MIDPELLRQNPDAIRASQTARGERVELVDAALEADVARRAALTAFETLRAEQNAFGKTVASASSDERPALVAQAGELAARVKEANQRANDAAAEFDAIVMQI